MALPLTTRNQTSNATSSPSQHPLNYRWIASPVVVILLACSFTFLLCEDLKLPAFFSTAAGTTHAVCTTESASASPSTALTTSPLTELTKPQRKIPKFENGGLVIFFHLAKTGGTGIRINFNRTMPHVQVEHVGTMDGMHQASLTATKFLEQRQDPLQYPDKTVLFLELHGILPSLFAMHAAFANWRVMAARHNTTFFTFSVLREPVSYAVSYFNFYQAEPCSFSTCKTALVQPSEDNLSRLLLFNHQCELLAREHWELFGTRAELFHRNVTADECRAAYVLLKADMDWVGTTAALSTETLPLLTSMLTHNAAKGAHMDPINKSWKPGRLTVDALSVPTVNRIVARSQYDIELYEAALRDYPVSMWEDLVLPTSNTQLQQQP